MKKLNDCLETHNLLDLIKNRAKNIRKDFVTNPHAQHIESELNFIILCAEKVLNNGWISVDDELPELFKDVLCFYDGHYEIASYDGDEFYDAEERCVICTHWQCLPNPPTSKE